MNKLEEAYEYLNGEEINAKLAEKIYLEVYESNAFSQADKAEAAIQLGYLYSGIFDDPNEGIAFKNIQKSKTYFRLAYVKGNREAKLELALLYCKDKTSMIEELEFAIDTLISQQFAKTYKKEAIDAIKNYYNKVVCNDVDDLLNIFKKLSDFQSKTKEREIYNVLLSCKKRIAITISEILLSEIESVKDCNEAKRILFDINDDNVVGGAIGELNVRIVKFELDDFNDINKIEKIEKDIKRFDRHESYELYNLFSDLLNLKIATSYAYGINRAPLDYAKAIKHFINIRSSSTLNKADDEIEKLIQGFIIKGNFELALSFVAILKNDRTRAEFKSLINKKEEAIAFYKTLEKANSGSEEAKLQLASYYLTGFGVQANKERAIEIYKELYYSSNPKPAFDALFKVLVGTELKGLLKEAKERGIEFNRDEQAKYNDFFVVPKANVVRTPPVVYKNDYFDLFEPSSFGGMSQKYRDILAQELKRRSITKLIHFTSESNLHGIKRLGGILSRKQLSKHPEIQYSVTDENRLDGELNGISISITKPNSFMLDQKIENGQIIKPCIIEIRAELLLDPNIRFIFCESNAARYDKNKGPLFKDFLRMFQNSEPITFRSRSGVVKSMTRQDLWRRDNETTDEQAEILVEGMIPMKYIIGAHRYR